MSTHPLDRLDARLDHALLPLRRFLAEVRKVHPDACYAVEEDAVFVYQDTDARARGSQEGLLATSSRTLPIGGIERTA